MGGVDIVEAVGPEAEEVVVGFCDVYERGSGPLF